MKSMLFLLILTGFISISGSVYSESYIPKEQDAQVAQFLANILLTSYDASKETNSAYEESLKNAFDYNALVLEESLDKHSFESLKYRLGIVAMVSGAFLALSSLNMKQQQKIGFIIGIAISALGYFELINRFNADYFLENKTYELYEEQFTTLRRFSFLLKNMMNTTQWQSLMFALRSRD